MVLKESISEFFNDPKWGMNNELITRRSTELWAAKELLLWIIKHPDLPPEEALKDFIQNCNRCTKYSKESKQIFTIAIEMASSMIEIIRAMN